MKPLRKKNFLLFVIGIFLASACGPYFPDTVLSLPQAALRVRASCTLDEMVAIDRTYGRGLTQRAAGQEMIRRSYINHSNDWQQSEEQLKRDERRSALQPIIAAGMSEERAMAVFPEEGSSRTEAIELAMILFDQKIKPERVAEIITGFSQWRKSLPEIDLAGPWVLPTPEKQKVSAPPHFPELPTDIALYWKAAHAWRSGEREEARQQWQSILQLPAIERKNRAVWAAWMLAKTSPDAQTAISFYRQAYSLAESGCRDTLGLAALSMGWIAYAEEDPLARLKCYFDAACLGNEDMLLSIREPLGDIFTNPVIMQRAAEDPLAREIVTALCFTGRSRLDVRSDPEDLDSDAWLTLLEKNTTAKPSASAAKAAWICYGRAHFDAARRWLTRADPNAGEVLWLKAKLALRDGKINDAAKFFAKAAPAYTFAEGQASHDPHLDDLSWYEPATNRDGMIGQFHTDRATVHIARGEFIQALGFLAKAKYDTDAAYLAERVLTTDELVAWVKQNRPAPKRDPQEEPYSILPDGRIWIENYCWNRDQYRYLLARRLAREFRFREAAEFMPHALQSVFAHYVRLHRASLEPSITKDDKALILWHVAHLHRRLGMEMFGYEGAPDHADCMGSFEREDFVALRSNAMGWRAGWENDFVISPPKEAKDFAIPKISREEIGRIKPYIGKVEPRFHYRYDAAEIAWRAAALLPDNDPRTFYILHEAGNWLSARDPQAANRFYLAIMRRCPDLPEWQELKQRRWFFIEKLESRMPALPKNLRFRNAKNDP